MMETVVMSQGSVSECARSQGGMVGVRWPGVDEYEWAMRSVHAAWWSSNRNLACLTVSPHDAKKTLVCHQSTHLFTHQTNSSFPIIFTHPFFCHASILPSILPTLQYAFINPSSIHTAFHLAYHSSQSHTSIHSSGTFTIFHCSFRPTHNSFCQSYSSSHSPPSANSSRHQSWSICPRNGTMRPTFAKPVNKMNSAPHFIRDAHP